jgi:SAM-dependent methyltransferase
VTGEGPRPPRYLDALLADFARPGAPRHNHLGHWDDPDAAQPGSHRAAQDRMVEVVADLAGIGAEHVVVDVGCGFAGTLAWLARQGRARSLVGIDVDGRQLAADRALCAGLPGAPALVQGDGSQLPLGPATVDRVLAIEVLWHLPSRAGFFRDVRRVLRPGGRVAVVDLLLVADAADRAGVEPAALAAELREGFDPWPEVGATLDDVLATADAAGLRLVGHVDATEATLPTYHDHGDADERPGAAAFSSSSSVARFVSLQHEGLLRIHYLAFELAA